MGQSASNGLRQIAPRDARAALDQFAYIVSHDVRNSARALAEIPLWLCEDIQALGHDLTPDMQDNIDLLDRHARRLDRMFEDLLAYSRVGRPQTVRTQAVEPLVRDALAVLGHPAHLSVDVAGDVPDLTMGEEDAARLMLNILSNAARHGIPDGTVLTITGRRDGGFTCLTFADNGPGVPDADIPRIFEPMTTLRRRDEVEGSGMGLAIIAKLVAQSGGQLWAGAGPEGRGFCLQVQVPDAAGANYENKEMDHVLPVCATD